MQKLKYLNYDQLDGGRLRDHQAEGVAFMAATPKTFCADPPGAGKTLQAAGLIAFHLERGVVTPERPALVVTMGEQLAVQTAKELGRFLPKADVLCLAGVKAMSSASPEPKRVAALNAPADVKVMTYSQWRTRGHLWTGSDPSVLILDEVSALKNGHADYASMLPLAVRVERVHLFSATPYENHPIETWILYSLLNLPQLPTRAEFEADYVKWSGSGSERRPQGWRSTTAARRWRALIAAHHFRRIDALDGWKVPRCNELQVIYAELTDEQDRLYANVARMPGKYGYQQRAKVVRGSAGANPSMRSALAAHMIVEVIKYRSDAKILIFADFLNELDDLQVDLTMRGVTFRDIRGGVAREERADIVERFREDLSCHVLMGTEVLERGLNLQFCQWLFSIGLPDNPAAMEQREGRLCRPGSPFHEVWHYVCLSATDFDRAAPSRVRRKQYNAALMHGAA